MLDYAEIFCNVKGNKIKEFIYKTPKKAIYMKLDISSK